MKTFYRLAFGLFFSLLTFPAFGEESPVVGDIPGFQAEAGYMRNFASDPKDGFYYKASYKGNQFLTKGSLFTLADINKPKFSTYSASKTEGDTNRYAVTIERGTAQIKSGIFDLVGRKEFKIPVKFMEKLRGVANFSGTLDGEQINVSAGLESPSFHPLGFLNEEFKLGLTNWLIIGVNGETRPNQKIGSDNSDYGQLTYRAFIGRGFKWVKSNKMKEDIVSEILKRAPTKLAATSEAEKIKSTYNPRTGILPPFIDSLIRQASEDNSPIDWEDLVKYHVKKADLPPDRPTYALWLEDSGWYSFIGNEPVRRFNNIFGTTFTVWIEPEINGNSWIRFIYENGYDKASPTTRKNLFVATVGLDF